VADLSPLAAIVGKAAPALGAIIAGPLGGAAVTILAELFGTQDSPDAVTTAIASSDPEIVAARLAEAEARFKAAAEEAITQRAQIDAHVEMMRLDYGRGWFWGSWRPLAGWIATLWSAAICLVSVRDIWLGSYGLLNEAVNLLMIGGPIMALAGIYAYGKSSERKAIATGGAGQVVEALRRVIKRK
jgi:hypothetical protein